MVQSRVAAGFSQFPKNIPKPFHHVRRRGAGRRREEEEEEGGGVEGQKQLYPTRWQWSVLQDYHCYDVPACILVACEAALLVWLLREDATVSPIRYTMSKSTALVFILLFAVLFRLEPPVS